MLGSTDNSLYGTTDTQRMREQARKKNDEELDRLCKNCCLGIFIYIIYLIYIH